MTFAGTHLLMRVSGQVGSNCGGVPVQGGAPSGLSAAQSVLVIRSRSSSSFFKAALAAGMSALSEGLDGRAFEVSVP